MSTTQPCHSASPRPERSELVARRNLHPPDQRPAPRSRIGVRLWGKTQTLFDSGASQARKETMLISWSAHDVGADDLRQVHVSTAGYAAHWHPIAVAGARLTDALFFFCKKRIGPLLLLG